MSGETTPLIEQHWFDDDGVVPNNPRLPLVVYRGVLESGPGAAAACETLFAGNGWSGGWRGGVYPYHHYHSTAHEALGCYRGSARVQFGGEHGVIEEFAAGDVLIIPAGVAHKNLGATDDFAIVGAYPSGQRYDMNYGKPGERPQADKNISRVPLPTLDPVLGQQGPLLKYWAKK